MDRRNIFRTALAAGLGLVAARSAEAEETRARKCVYHLSDPDRINFLLGNLRNHIEGTGGPGQIALAVVVNGPALKNFRSDTKNEDLKIKYGDSVKSGVVFHACHHTMSAQKLALADLLPGFVIAPKGGVVLLADLQAQGWAYVRP